MLVRARVDGVMRRFTTIPKSHAAGGDEPPEDHGRARHRRAARAAGRPHLDPLRRQSDRPAHRLLPDHARRADRPSLDESGRRPPRHPRSRYGPDAEAKFARAIRQPHGAVLAVGPTGSGKTTTLYAALDVLNEDDRVLMTIEDPVEHQIARRQPDRGQLQERSDVRARPAHDPSLRPGRLARRRDPRRGDGTHRDPGSDDRPPRAQHASHAQRCVVDRASRRHGRRAEPDRDLDQLHRRAASRAPALHRTAASRTWPEAAELAELGDRAADRRHRLYRAVRLRECGGTGYSRPRRALRGHADQRHGSAA